MSLRRGAGITMMAFGNSLQDIGAKRQNCDQLSIVVEYSATPLDGVISSEQKDNNRAVAGVEGGYRLKKRYGGIWRPDFSLRIKPRSCSSPNNDNPPNHLFTFRLPSVTRMKGDETRQQRDDDSESESEDEEEVEEIKPIDVDVTKLTPLSPEVISKQVRRSGAAVSWDMC